MQKKKTNPVWLKKYREDKKAVKVQKVPGALRKEKDIKISPTLEPSKEKILAKLSYIRKHNKSVINTFISAYSGRSKAAGLKALCIECMGFDKKEIKECTAPTCPLWCYRPYSKAK